MNDILTMRTELANDLAVAGAKLLHFTATAGALAAIPDTAPQQYVVAGTLESIQQVLPVADTPARRKDDRHPIEPLTWDEAGASQPQAAAAPSVKTWAMRQSESGYNRNAEACMLDEIADLRALLASTEQAKAYEQRHAAESEIALAEAHTQLQLARQQATPAAEPEYELHQDDMMVAGASGKNAWQEIQHYAAQYSQDGPVEIFEVTRRKVDPAAPASLVAVKQAEPVQLPGVSEQIERGAGFWQPCSGCHETEDGHPVGRYLYSNTMRCALGNGCSECGGIGAVWDNNDYDAMAADWHKPDIAPPAASAKPVGYARETELAKLDDGRIAGVGMMIHKEASEGKVALYLGAVAPAASADAVVEAERYRKLRDLMCFSQGSDGKATMTLRQPLPAPHHDFHTDWIADRFDVSVNMTVDALPDDGSDSDEGVLRTGEGATE